MSMFKQLDALLLRSDHEGVCALLQDPECAPWAHHAAATVCSMVLSDANQEQNWCKVLASALDAGVEVDHVSDMGTLLSAASRVEGLRRMDLLLDRGARIDFRPRGIPSTPLMYAVEYQHSDAMKRLLARGANVHERDNHGQTALFWAVRVASGTCLDILLAAEADVHTTDDQGRKLLHEAVSLASSAYSHAARIQAVEDGVWACRRLVELGVDAEARDHHGQSALEAVCAQDPQLQHALRAAWARKNAGELSAQTAATSRLAVRRCL